ncbi:MAG: ACT domain-containing protein [Rhabdochlamydiaceae bacterium]|nr:ACT domain-containing protein [Rhabdochlamydiaceae bacterium]
MLSSLAGPLAQAQISIFAISTFDTDYLCVKETNQQKTIEILGNFCKILC